LRDRWLEESHDVGKTGSHVKERCESRSGESYTAMRPGGILMVATVAAIAIVVASGGDGSAKDSANPFGPHYAGLEARREAAGVPTMAEAQTVGAVHFHPHLAVYVNGKKIKVPANVGIDPTKSPLEMAGLHTHDTSGWIHNEAGTSSKLGQFFAVWGVRFSRTRLGPYRATKTRRVKMWVDRKPSLAFRSLQLEDGQQIVVAYGRRSQMPFSARD
jgi:hypothetical protein